jgi:hypothetical protein
LITDPRQLGKRLAGIVRLAFHDAAEHEANNGLVNFKK